MSAVMLFDEGRWRKAAQPTQLSLFKNNLEQTDK
jgi:hypothetical protein